MALKGPSAEPSERGGSYLSEPGLGPHASHAAGGEGAAPLESAIELSAVGYPEPRDRWFVESLEGARSARALHGVGPPPSAAPSPPPSPPRHSPFEREDWSGGASADRRAPRGRASLSAQLGALFTKRLTCALRDPFAVLTQQLLPVLLVFFILSSLGWRGGMPERPPLPMSASIFADQHRGVYTPPRAQPAGAAPPAPRTQLLHTADAKGLTKPQAALLSYLDPRAVDPRPSAEASSTALSR